MSEKFAARLVELSNGLDMAARKLAPSKARIFITVNIFPYDPDANDMPHGSVHEDVFYDLPLYEKCDAKRNLMIAPTQLEHYRQRPGSAYYLRLDVSASGEGSITFCIGARGCVASENDLVTFRSLFPDDESFTITLCFKRLSRSVNELNAIILHYDPTAYPKLIEAVERDALRHIRNNLCPFFSLFRGDGDNDDDDDSASLRDGNSDISCS